MGQRNIISQVQRKEGTAFAVVTGAEILGIVAGAHAVEDIAKEVKQGEHAEVAVGFVAFGHGGLPMGGGAEPVGAAGDFAGEVRQHLGIGDLYPGHQGDGDDGDEDDDRLEHVGEDDAIEAGDHGIDGGDADEDDRAVQGGEGQKHVQEQADALDHVGQHADGEEDFGEGAEDAGGVAAGAGSEAVGHPFGAGHAAAAAVPFSGPEEVDDQDEDGAAAKFDEKTAGA